MRREAAERHRFHMRPPRQLIFRDALQEPPRRSHLVIEVREQPVFDRHPNILAASFRVFVCSWLIATVLVLDACSRTAPPPPPLVAQVSGTIEAAVSAPVRVVRDTWGIPHIYAQTADDLFFAQGFVQAQDRLFQLDLWRRAALGRLSEVLGGNFIDRDTMTRRIQY